ncbi:3',5'-cyclic-AMP phosphodiesterase [Acinetobacter sp. B5B]|uniref:3',5'-cyclic-AMP phosphodiesterase n=1 Tax=Acinetobacter baretiae TaxID=2605383 RepID=UPI0018C2ED47|nr:3',5'-cyclic-AMP phosphodiesterase [Acinetobacter baretiae]MBF7681736.1 3',5'-cyclic-AMP phosphodiesterase [Acinetobacter baretiae]MBF7685345.1 3',5'-cyclic-AMP phosphodiesterase [Acinetobacter baretiae]
MIKTLVQISDTHLMDTPEKVFIEMNPEYTFHRIMHDICQRHDVIDSIIHTGDVAQIASPETYHRYLKYMQTLDIPFYQTPGNHDNLTHFPYPQQQKVTVIDLEQWCIVLLCSAVTGQTDGHIDDEQLTLLEGILQQQQDKHIILGCHHHPLHIDSDWIDQHCLKNTRDFSKIIEKHHNIKAIIHGHIHQEAQVNFGNIMVLSVPSTCVQFKPKSKDFALDEAAPGYRVLKLHDNGHLETEIYRVYDAQTEINPHFSGY